MLRSKNKKVISVATAMGGDFALGTAMTLASAAYSRSNLSSPLHAIVLDNNASDEQFEKLTHLLDPHTHVITIQREVVSSKRFATYSKKYDNLAPYSRLLLPEITDLDDLIYLDSDLLVLKDLGAFPELDPEQNHLALVVNDPAFPTLADDCPCPDKVADLSTPYFNSGVMRFSPKSWSVNKISEACYTVLDHYPCRFFDQSALNVVLQNRIGFISPEWNFQRTHWSRKPLDQNPRIYHFNSFKPWMTFRREPAFFLWYAFYEVLLNKSSAVSDLRLNKSMFSEIIRFYSSPIRASVFSAISNINLKIGNSSLSKKHSEGADFWRTNWTQDAMRRSDKKSIIDWKHEFNSWTKGAPDA
jgi:lipopolysaccharide biosynthesis glycosyltransferase